MECHFPLADSASCEHVQVWTAGRSFGQSISSDANSRRAAPSLAFAVKQTSSQSTLAFRATPRGRYLDKLESAEPLTIRQQVGSQNRSKALLNSQASSATATSAGTAFESIFPALTRGANSGHPLIAMVLTKNPAFWHSSGRKSEFWHLCQNKNRRPEGAGSITVDFSTISGATRRG